MPAPPRDTVASSRLRKLARRSPGPAQAQAGAAAQVLSLPGEAATRQIPPDQIAEEQCELCGAPIGARHQHLLDTSERRIMCACRACALLFDRKAASDGHYLLVPDRRLRIEDFELDDPRWEGFAIPVDMAFFFRNTQLDRVVAFYPGPAGATESQLELHSWEELEKANPIVAEMEPDVEALLVNRARGAREHWLVPIDDCYDLVGLMRKRWKGLSGGQEVWQEIGRFFDQLGGRAKTVKREGTAAKATRRAQEPAAEDKEAAWQTT